jgi:hypothetical protein
LKCSFNLFHRHWARLVEDAANFDAVGNEDVMEPGMLSHPGPGLSTVMAGEVVGDDEDIAFRTLANA